MFFFFPVATNIINRLDVDDRNVEICNKEQQAKLPPQLLLSLVSISV